MKRCTKCGEEKPATGEYFQARKDSKDGFRGYCRNCLADYKHAHYLTNWHELRARNRTYYEANKPKIHAQQRIYRKLHKGDQRRIAHEWYEANKEKTRLQVRVYRSAHPEVQRSSNQKRKARTRGVEGSYHSEDVRIQIRMQTDKKGKLRCWWCDKTILSNDYHIDHRIPLAQGGNNCPENIVIAHSKCNLSKGAKLSQEWNGRLL